MMPAGFVQLPLSMVAVVQVRELRMNWRQAATLHPKPFSY